MPAQYAGQPLTLEAETEIVRIFKNGLIAEHTRCYGRKIDIVDPDHQKALREQRSKAKAQQLQQDFLNISPYATEFLEKRKLRELDVLTSRHRRGFEGGFLLFFIGTYLTFRAPARWGVF